MSAQSIVTERRGGVQSSRARNPSWLVARELDFGRSVAACDTHSRKGRYSQLLSI